MTETVLLLETFLAVVLWIPALVLFRHRLADLAIPLLILMAATIVAQITRSIVGPTDPAAFLVSGILRAMFVTIGAAVLAVALWERRGK